MPTTTHQPEPIFPQAAHPQPPARQPADPLAPPYGKLPAVGSMDRCRRHPVPGAASPPPVVLRAATADELATKIREHHGDTA